MNQKRYKICIIGGDGVGPELMWQTCRLLTATGIQFKFNQQPAGFQHFQKAGSSLPDQTVATAKSADAVLFGAVTTPPHIVGYRSPILSLRKALGLYANVRPIVSLPIPQSRKDLNFYIVRENTEDLYSGIEEKIPDGFVAHRVITRTASIRIIQFAFELARRQGKKLVTVVHKANVLRKTDGLFLEVAAEVAKKYPDIAMEDMLVDSAAMRIIKDPSHFHVLVTTNMFGDILSDVASMLIGGLGVEPSGNYGEKHALFEPVHGSAPKYAGKDSINPTASFLASALMLEYLGEHSIANKVRKAITTTLTKIQTQDLGGSATTSALTDAVIQQIKKVSFRA